MRKHFNSSHLAEETYLQSSSHSNLALGGRLSPQSVSNTATRDQQNSQLNTSKYNLASSRQQLMSDEMSQELTYLSREAPLDGGESTLAAPSYSQLGLANSEEPADSMVNVTALDERSLSQLKADNVDIKKAPLKQAGFLVSFMVDARGGAMRGCRHSGARVIIPAGCAPQPMRITCRYLRRERLVHPPPLMEGEACASRIMEVGPAGARFLGPVLIEVPHFASLGDANEREIIILRSDNGQVWREHVPEFSDDLNEQQRLIESIIRVADENEAAAAAAAGNGENLDPAAYKYQQQQQHVIDSADESILSNLSNDQRERRLTRIVTHEFPQYFAIISRVRQQSHTVGPDGLTVSSESVPKVQAIFTEGALTKRIKIGLQKKDESSSPDASLSQNEQEIKSGQQDSVRRPPSSSPKRRSRKLLACFGSQNNDGSLGQLNDVQQTSSSSGPSSVDSGHQSPPTTLTSPVRGANLRRPSQLVPEDYYKAEQGPPLILNLEPTTYGKRLASSAVQTDSSATNANKLSTHARPKKRSISFCSRRQKCNLTIDIEDPSISPPQKALDGPADKAIVVRDASGGEKSSEAAEANKPEQDDDDKLAREYLTRSASSSKWRTCPIQTDSDSVTIQYVTIAQNPNLKEDPQQVGASASASGKADPSHGPQPGDDGYVSGSGGSLDKTNQTNNKDKNKSKKKQKSDDKKKIKDEKRRAKEVEAKAEKERRKADKEAEKTQKKQHKSKNKDKKSQDDELKDKKLIESEEAATKEDKVVVDDEESSSKLRSQEAEVEKLEAENPNKQRNDESIEVGAEKIDDKKLKREKSLEVEVEVVEHSEVTVSETKPEEPKEADDQHDRAIENLASELVKKTTDEAIRVSSEKLAKTSKADKKAAKEAKKAEKEAEKEAKQRAKEEAKRVKRESAAASATTTAPKEASSSSFLSRLFKSSSSSKSERVDKKKKTTDDEVAGKSRNKDEASDTKSKKKSKDKSSKDTLITTEMYPNESDGELVLEVSMPRSLIEDQLKQEAEANKQQLDQQQTLPSSDSIKEEIDERTCSIADQSAGADNDQPTTISEQADDTLLNVSQLPTASEPVFLNQNSHDDATSLQQQQTAKTDDATEQLNDVETENQFSVTTDPLSDDSQAADLPASKATGGKQLPERASVDQLEPHEPEPTPKEPANDEARIASDVTDSNVAAVAETAPAATSGAEAKLVMDEKSRKELEAKLKREAEKQAKEEKEAQKRQAKEDAKRAKEEKKKADADRKRELAEQKKREKEEAKRVKEEKKKAKKDSKSLSPTSSKSESKSKDQSTVESGSVGQTDEAGSATPTQKTASSTEEVKLKTPEEIIAENPEYASMVPVNEENETQTFVEETIDDEGYVTRVTKVLQTKSVTLRGEETQVIGKELPEGESIINVADMEENPIASCSKPTAPASEPKLTVLPVELIEVCSSPSCFEDLESGNPKLQDPETSQRKRAKLIKKELKKRIKLNEKLVKRALGIAKRQSKLAQTKAKEAQAEVPASSLASKSALKEASRAKKQAKKAEKLSVAAHKKMDKVDKKLAKQQKKIDKKQEKLNKKAVKAAEKQAKKDAKAAKKDAKDSKKALDRKGSSKSRKSIKLEDIGEPKLKSASRLLLTGSGAAAVAGSGAAAVIATTSSDADDQIVDVCSLEADRKIGADMVDEVEMHIEDTPDQMQVGVESGDSLVEQSIQQSLSASQTGEPKSDGSTQNPHEVSSQGIMLEADEDTQTIPERHSTSFGEVNPSFQDNRESAPSAEYHSKSEMTPQSDDHSSENRSYINEGANILAQQLQQSHHQQQEQHFDASRYLAQMSEAPVSIASNLLPDQAFQPHRLEEPLIEEPEPAEEVESCHEQLASYEKTNHVERSQPSSPVSSHEQSQQIEHEQHHQMNPQHSSRFSSPGEELSDGQIDDSHQQRSCAGSGIPTEPTMAQYIQYQSEPTSISPTRDMMMQQSDHDGLDGADHLESSSHDAGHEHELVSSDAQASSGSDSFQIEHQPQEQYLDGMQQGEQSSPTITQHQSATIEPPSYLEQLEQQHQEDYARDEHEFESLAYQPPEREPVERQDSNLVSFSPSPQPLDEADDDSSFADSTSPEPVLISDRQQQHQQLIDDIVTHPVDNDDNQFPILEPLHSERSSPAAIHSPSPTSPTNPSSTVQGEEHEPSNIFVEPDHSNSESENKSDLNNSRKDSPEVD